MSQEPAQYPNQLVACDEVHLPSGGNCNNGNIHVYCNGTSPATCERFVNGNPTTVYAVYSVDYCGDASTGTIYLDQYTSGTWSNITSGGGCSGATAYCYWTWSIYETDHLRFRFGSDINNPDQTAEFYIGWYYLHIYITDYADVPLSGITTTWTSSDGQSGTEYTSVINILIPSGTSVTYSCEPYLSGCAAVTAEVCSTTVSNITSDTNSTIKMYPYDFCRVGEIMIPVAGTYLCCFNVAIHNLDISDSPRSCEMQILESWGEIGLEVIYPDSWSSEYTLVDGTHFSFHVTDIFNNEELRVIFIDQVCYANRPNQSINIDRSTIYVDCTNGDNAQTGLCNFTNAVQTITYAQTIVDSGGTIKVKYGNCINEDLNAVLNPIVDSVFISPVQDETTEGTGTLSISDA